MNRVVHIDAAAIALDADIARAAIDANEHLLARNARLESRLHNLSRVVEMVERHMLADPCADGVTKEWARLLREARTGER